MVMKRKSVHAEVPYEEAQCSNPIPPRASAYPDAVVKVRPRYSRALQEGSKQDITTIATVPPVMWQYETPNYEVESSLSSLSLVVDDVASPVPLSPAIDELDTLPPVTQATVSHIADLDTVPPSMLPGAVRTRKLTAELDIAELPTVPTKKAPLHQGRSIFVLLSLFYARYQEKKSLRQKSYTLHFNILDRVRWWLLSPGRLEFLLWLCGTVVLLVITMALLFMTILSFAGARSGPATFSPTDTSAGDMGTGLCSTLLSQHTGMTNCVVATTMSSDGLQLAMFNQGPFVAGGTVHIEGRGFAKRSELEFTHDNHLACQPAHVLTNQQGMFNAVLILGKDWEAGNHRLTVLDLTSKHAIVLDFMVATHYVKKAPVPATTATPANAASTVTIGGGNTVNQNPVSVSPTAVVSRPKPIPTATSQPTVAPTVAPTSVAPMPTSTPVNAPTQPAAGNAPVQPTPGT